MNMKELSKLSDADLENLSYQMMLRDNMNAASRIDEVRKFYHKTVTVVKGRKVPHGTTGECFWMGAYDNSKYGDPGEYTQQSESVSGIQKATSFGLHYETWNLQKDEDGNDLV